MNTSLKSSPLICTSPSTHASPRPVCNSTPACIRCHATVQILQRGTHLPFKLSGFYYSEAYMPGKVGHRKINNRNFTTPESQPRSKPELR